MSASPPEGARLRAFGLDLVVDAQGLPGAWRPAQTPTGPSPLELRVVAPGTVAANWSGRAGVGWEGTIDGAPFTVEVGRAGDHRFVHGEQSVHHLSADTRVLLCAPLADPEPLWWRVVLDSVLFTVALLRGYESLHAAAVAGPDGALAITGPSGAGKSTVIAELVSRGMPLLADDVLVLEARGGQTPLAHPGPPLMTVPTEQIDLLAPLDASNAIAALGEEHWVAVPVHHDPVPLAEFVVLERGPGLKLALSPVQAPLPRLMSALMPFPRSPDRDRARFDLASVIASRAVLRRLTAGPDTRPREIADVLLAGGR